MRPLPVSPIFSRAELRACGWSDSAVSRALRSGRLSVLRRGQFTAGGLDRTPGTQGFDVAAVASAVAATRACAGSVASHRSALTVHRLPVLGRWDGTPEVTARPRHVGSLAAAHLHRATLWSPDIVLVDGLAVTSVARTLIDVARSRPTSTAVAAIDAALHRRIVTTDELDDVVLRCWNWPGIARAHRALRLADGRAESPLESVSRLTIQWLRLPPPRPQAVVLDRSGRPVARLDFYWDDVGVAGEADGRAKYDSRDVLTAEKDRQEVVEDLGVHFARWGWDHVARRPQELRRRIESAFTRGRLRDRSGFRRGWSIQPG